MKTDVCIIGAGPAGATTSLFLAKQGIPHVIIDKATFPRDKTCGDGLILHVFQTLKALNPAWVDELMQHPRFLPSFDTHFFSQGGHGLAFDFRHEQGHWPHAPILFGRRIDFDHFLVQKLDPTWAESHFGATVQGLVARPEGVEVAYTTAEGQARHLMAKVVVGADGIQSMVARQLGPGAPPRHTQSAFVSGYYEGVQGLQSPTAGEIRLVGEATPLWFYIFPLTGGQCNVSLGGPSLALSQHHINLREQLHHCLQTHPRLAAQFAQARPVGKLRGWGIPQGSAPRPLSGAGYLLTGDAAGLANPFYKEGVGTSMHSGRVAAEYIGRAVAQNQWGPAAWEGYTPAVYREVRHLLRVGHRMQRLAAYPRSFDWLVRLGRPLIRRGIHRLVARISYPELRQHHGQK